MNIENETKNRSGRGGAWLAAAALAGLTAFGGYQYHRNQEMESRMARMDSATTTELASIKQAAEARAAAARDTIDQLTEELKQTAGQAASLKRANTTTEKRALALANDLAQQQRAQAAELEQTIGSIKEVAAANAQKLGEVASETGEIKQTVERHRSQLEEAAADLKSVRGDLGVASGRIATNSQELATLRALGERDYFEFSIAKADGARKVGGIQLALRKADSKRSKFNLDVIADDRRIEKKGKTLNEPVQFYVEGARQPLEVVVNRIDKNRVTGYLATPRTMQARR